MKKFLFLFIVLNNLLVVAQPPKIDSFEEKLLQLHSEKDTARVNLLNELADLFFSIVTKL